MSTKILIVDDEQCVRDIFTMALTDFGCEVVCADSVESALREVRSGDFDVAFIDVVLPDGLGTQVLEAIKAAHPTKACCMLTGHPDKFAKIKADYASQGFTLSMMLKPVWPEQILEAATELLAKGRDAKYCNVKSE